MKSKAYGILCGVLFLASAKIHAEPYKLLVFHKEAAGWFTHDSIKDGISMFKQMAVDQSFELDVHDDPSLFTDENLAQYHAIAFLHTSGDFFDEAQKLAFQKFVRSGKGWLGTHCADNTLNKWDWYHQMVGSEFRGDAWQDNLPLIIRDKDHPSVKGLPVSWSVNDQYRKNTWRFDENTAGFNVIIQVDPKHYEGKIGQEKGKWSNQSFVPYVYTHEFEGGRVWYGAMGHSDKTFKDPNWIRIISWGVDYAFGKFATPLPATN
jgi:type 1 glutamine amidotransferase